MYGFHWDTKDFLSSYIMDALNQYYHCFKGEQLLIHTNEVICEQNKFYIW